MEDEVIEAMRPQAPGADAWELNNLSSPHRVANLDAALGPNQVRYQAQFYDALNDEYIDISVNYDPDTNIFGTIKFASGK